MSDQRKIQIQMGEKVRKEIQKGTETNTEVPNAFVVSTDRIPPSQGTVRRRSRQGQPSAAESSGTRPADFPTTQFDDFRWDREFDDIYLDEAPDTELQGTGETATPTQKEGEEKDQH